MTGLTRTLDLFVRRLAALYGDALVSVELYGSAARGDYAPDRSDVNIAVILSDASLPEIARAHTLVNERAFRRLRVLFMTERYISGSLDVFPIEFLDMQASHKALYGKDVFSAIAVDTRHLRFQCEHELRSKLLALSAGYLRTTGRAAAAALLTATCTSLVHIARNLVRLKGMPCPADDRAIAAALRQAFAIDASALDRALEIKHRGTRPSYAASDALLAQIHALIGRLIESVDTL